MTFRSRLALFLVAILIVVQALTAGLVYGVTRRALIDEGRRQLDVASGAFARQLDDLSARVASSVQVLSLDFALRSAIAQRDRDTVLSALRNHGRRVGATQMLLVGLDGRVEADTAGRFAEGAAFPYADLVARAPQQPAAAVVAANGRANWMVVVPVFAPDLVGYIAAAIPVDDALLAKLQAQSALPKEVELAAREGGRWHAIARGTGNSALTPAIAARGDTLPRSPELATLDGREYVVQAVPLDHSRSSPAVAAVLGYSVDAALQPYRAVAIAWAGLLGFGLVVGLIGAWLIARGVSRPVERLAASARRIEAGDYAPVDAPARDDEIGALAAAFDSMTQAIREREAHIVHQATHDPVTGLANRSAAEASIQRALDDVDGDAALLMVGLERAPAIVKTLGHGVGDRLMHEVGQRLSGPAGAALIARVTDSQFAVFLPNTSPRDAHNCALRLIDVLSDPYREAELRLDLAPAVGIALSPLHGRDAATLLRRADVALIAALGADEPVAIYDAATDPHRPERLSLMGDLQRALGGDALALHFQPKLHLASGRIDGAEGLVRWSHPERGPLAPDVFVGLAEETGNIRRLTRWVLDAGIAQASRWQSAGRAVRVALNVSARDLEDAELPRRIATLLATHHLAADRVVLEITESALMRDPEAALPVLHRLADQGIALSIDDFGVGQSSFAYLRRLPVRELKIDRAFVAPLAHSREDRMIVKSIVELAHALGYHVTAEGVEDPAALDYLAGIGCDHAQGFLIARPMAVSAFDAFVAAREVSS
ncbi:EAL domain-containing protein [Lysobacter sp. TY2-98]|uniref:putative bifunctional diguanylate cyclase/phosphodiesterase n=1 Tax=Lysobacter sp. TY2-98 TaxID=2290922 RepID=UPI000E206FC1|nr:EAL domain-containing protein [Lysobacter sp. TY2-98]AXK73259.1 EAL domain-containing protein [Lysobacter sp. TY2-98]